SNKLISLTFRFMVLLLSEIVWLRETNLHLYFTALLQKHRPSPPVHARRCVVGIQLKPLLVAPGGTASLARAGLQRGQPLCRETEPPRAWPGFALQTR